MQKKDYSMRNFCEALRKRFGNKIFVAVDSDRLGSNHQVFRCASEQQTEFSVVSEMGTQAKYSIQVETNIGEPDLDIPIVAYNLSLDEALEIFSKYAKNA
jgi:hypothetical protein